MIKKLLSIALMSLVFITSTTRAELTIEITQGVDQPVPIAVVPFGWSGSGLKENAAKIVGDDLYRSGLFSIMKPETMLSFPSKQQDVFFRDWRLGGIEYLVIGRVMPSSIAGQHRVEYELYDVVKEQQLAAGFYAGDLRKASHRVSDAVYEKLTGIRGAFSTEIAYVSENQSNNGKKIYRLMLADADGVNDRELLKSEQPIMSPSWSRDGSQLAYVSFQTGRPGVFIQDKRTGKQTQITKFRGLNGAPSWSPDGKKLAVTLSKDGNPEIYVIDIATRELQRVTNHYGIDTEPTWSPDGRSILFTSDRGGRPQIYSKELATNWLERLTFEGDYNARGRLTHDGRHLVMVHRDQGLFNIAVQDLKTGRFEILTETYLDESPSIAPNGSMVIYATQDGTKDVLGMTSIDGRVKVKLPLKSGDIREPAWSPYLH